MDDIMNHNSRGFSLLELLTAMTVFGIILAFTSINMHHWLKRYQAYLTSTELHLLVLHARTYAVTHHRPLTLCGSSNGKLCDKKWDKGALLFEDANRNGMIDNIDIVIQYKEFNLKNAKLSWQGFGGSRLVFESMGITYASNGTFTYCEQDNNPLYSRQVIVNRGGRPRKSIDKNGDGLHEDSTGQPIQCLN